MTIESAQASEKAPWEDGVQVRGARQNNLKNVNLDIPRDSIVVFTGVSGSGKSSLAFGTLYAESQRRYLESVSPYARRLIDQVGVPDVDSVEGLPPAVALQQSRGSNNSRSDVATTTTLSSLVRMLFSRAGTYPDGADMLYAEDFSTNTPQGACRTCHGIGRIFDATEELMVPDPTKSIRERAIESWPIGWAGGNQRDILTSLGYDVERPWQELSRKDRDWILFTEERPTVPVYQGLDRKQAKKARQRDVEPSYMGTFIGARRHVLESFATTKSASVKKRMAQYVTSTLCPECHGCRLKPEALAVTFQGHNIAELSALPLAEVSRIAKSVGEPSEADRQVNLDADRQVLSGAAHDGSHPDQGTTDRKSDSKQVEPTAAARLLSHDLAQRIQPILDLGLGYLSLDRLTATLSGGERQRLRLATQLSSKLFGVAYVLDEPSAGLHPRDQDALVGILHGLKARGNSLLIVEHSLAVIREADWLVDIGPKAGEHGGCVLYSGRPEGLRDVKESLTRRYLFAEVTGSSDTARASRQRAATGWVELTGVRRNTVHDLNVRFPLGCLTAVTGVSGSGKSSLVSQALPTLLAEHLGQRPVETEEKSSTPVSDTDLLLASDDDVTAGAVARLDGSLRRVVVIDQKPIGRTPRSNIATYTGLFDHVRKLFASTPEAKKRRYSASRFSFNVTGGRCPTCEGEGSVMVELLFMPSVYSPCPDCNGTRYKASTLEVTWEGLSIADVLALSVDEALERFSSQETLQRSLRALHDVGLGYVRLGQPATELSGGEAQRVKLATELQRTSREDTLYILDEPTAGLHPSDADRLLDHLHALVDAGNTVVLVELDMRVVAQADHVIEMGPGAGGDGGSIVAAGTPDEVAQVQDGPSAPYLAAALARTR